LTRNKNPATLFAMCFADTIAAVERLLKVYYRYHINDDKTRATN